MIEAKPRVNGRGRLWHKVDMRTHTFFVKPSIRRLLRWQCCWMPKVTAVQSDDARDVVIGTIRKLTLSSARIDDQTRMLHDLSISGDDAVELLSTLEKQFGPITVGMDFNDYFPNETEGIWYWRGKFLGLCKPKKELTVGQLLMWIKLGRWTEVEGRATLRCD